jgi:MFS transporter, MHS family, shikimate and dehydroshikimate transport protein
MSESSDAAAEAALIRRVAFASCIGSIVEWYDFFVYATASALALNKLFFPSFDPLVGTLLALATYAVGFLARPLGGFLFGYVGDRFGRKGALVTTLLIVGIATFIIGVMPTYATIGVAAPIALVFIRLLHGFGIGGEQGNAILITCEHAPSLRRGYWGAWVQLGAPAGFVLPLGIFALLSATLSNGQFLTWGWRVPFLLSLLLVGIGLYIRLKLTESPLFIAMRRRREDQRHPIAAVLREHMRELLLGCGAKIAESTIFTSYAVLITAYGASRGLPRSLMTTAVLIGILVELVTLPLFGALADRIGRRPVYLLGLVVSAGLAFPLFGAVYDHATSLLWLGMIGGLGIGHSAMYGPQAAYFAELFPTRMRASGLSFVLQIGGMVGSVGTLAAGWLLQAAGGAPWLLAAYMVLVGVLSIVCTVVLGETAPRFGRVQDFTAVDGPVLQHEQRHT